MAQIQIRDKFNNGIKLIDVRLALSTGSSDSAYDDARTDDAGNTAFPVTLPSVNGYTLWINTRNINRKWQDTGLFVQDIDAQDIKIVLEPSAPTVLRISNDKFYDAYGEWKMVFSSNFMLAQLVAEGIDIVPLLYNNLNGYRIFGSYHWIAQQKGMKDWHPDNYPNYYQAVEQCAQILFDNGKYFSYNLICDNQEFGKDVAYLRAFQAQTCEILRNMPNALYSLGNENEKNGFNADNFEKPAGIISACGSGLSGGPAPLSRGGVWDIQYQHLRRDEKMFIDIPPVDAPSYYINHMLLFDETIGWASFNDPGKRTNNIDHAYKLGAIMRAYNGGVIHLHSGGHSELLTQEEVNAVNAFSEGMCY